MKTVRKFMVVLIAFLLVFNTSMLNVTYHVVSAAINNDTEPANLEQSENLFTAGSPLTFEEGKSYAIKNQSSHSVNVEFEPASPMNYDFVRYSSDAKIIQFEKDYSWNIGLDAGESIRITPKTNLKASIPNATEDEVFVCESEPALYSFTIEKNKHYEVTNNGEDRILIKNLFSWEFKGDIVGYDSEGGIKYFEKDKYGDLWLEKGDTVRISGNIEQDSQPFIPYDQKDDLSIKDSDPALYNYTIEKGKNYELVNTGDTPNQIKNFSSWEDRVEMIAYDAEGNIKSFDNNWYGEPWLQIGEKVRISANPNRDIQVYIPYSQKDFLHIQETDDPALYHFTLEKNKHYEIRNTDNSTIQLKNLSSWDKRGEIVVYDPEGKVRSFDQGWWGDLSLNEGEKARLSVNPEQTQEAYIPYEQKEMVTINESDPALYHFTLEKNKHYEIRNTGNSSIQLKDVSSWDKRGEIVGYDPEGKVSYFDQGWWGDLRLNEGEKVRLSVNPEQTQEPYVPYDQKDSFEITESNNPALYHFTLEKNKHYEIGNTSNSSIQLKDLSAYGSRGEIVGYDREGKVSFFDQGWWGDLWLNGGEKVRLSVNPEQTQEPFVPYDQKDSIEITESNNPALYHFTLEKNKHYEIRNTGNSSILMKNLSSWDKRGEIVGYDPEGKVSYFDKDWYGDLWLNVGEKVRFSVNPDQTQDAFIPYDQKDLFTMKESDPALYKYTLEPDKNYKVMNNSGEEVRIGTTSGYNFRFQVLKYDANATYQLWDDHYGDVILKDKEYFFASYAPQEQKKLVFYYPYDQFHNGVIIRESDSEYEDYFDILPKIKMNVSKILSKTDSEMETTKIDDSLKNYKFTIKNKTKDSQINDYFIKDNYIVFAKDSVDALDELDIKVESKNNDTESKEFNLTLDESSKGESNLSILELGKIRVSEKNPQKNVPMIRTLIFNEQGKIIETDSSNSGETIQSMPLLEGKYTVVLLKANGELWRMDQLSEFNDRGLVEGTDYLNYPIQVTNGKISTVNPNSIPILDEDRISFFDRKSTIFTTNTESVVQGGLLEVRLQYRFKDHYNETNINSASLKVTIPTELALIDNSVMLDGVKTNYLTSRIQDEITVPIKKMSGTLKFYVRPFESKDVQLRAMANFTFQNKAISEVLGTTNVNVNYVTMNGPKETNSKEITVTGIAPPKTKLSIYDDTTKIGETIVPASGKWSKQVTLANAYLGTVHLLTAKTMDQNPEKQSNQIQVSYLYKAPALKSATLVHNGASKNISNAFLKGEKPVVTINPSKPFTFKIVMLNGEAIDKMYISSSRNQEKKMMEAIYDKTTDSWIASGYFDPSNLGYVPGALNIEYTTKKEKVDLNGTIDFTKEEYVNALPDSFKDAKVEVIENTDTVSRTVIELADEEKTKIETVNTQTVIPNNVTRTTLINDGYTKISDDIYASFKVTNDKIIEDAYDFNKNVKKELYIQYFDKIPSAKPIITCFGIAENTVNIGKTLIDNVLLRDKILNSNLSAAEKKEQLAQLDALSTINVAYNSIKIVATVLEVAGLVSPPGILVTVALFAADQLISIFYENSMKSLEENGSWFAWLIDPSGFVYEALPENRLKGVKVTVYYKDPDTGQVLKWNAEEYEQINPLITNDNGEYAWDVPEGLWQVKYELEGYETTVSEWLPVPPPQTTVNIGMVSKKKPEVKVVNIFKDRTEVVFDKYMEVDSVNLSSIGLKDPKGKNIVQTVEAADAQKSDAGKLLAKKFIIHYIPNTTFALNAEYQLEVKNTVKTYAQVSPDQMIVVKTKYTALPQDIIAQENVDITYGQTTRIPIHVSDVTNASGVKVQVESEMNELVEPVESTVELDSKGEAFVSVKGNLPGQTKLLLTIVGTDVTKEINVNVLSVGTMAPNQKPTISASDVIINAGDKPNWLSGVTAYDQEDGDLTSEIKITQNTVNTSKPGIYKIIYSVSDSNGLTDTKEIKVTVKDVTAPLAPKVNAVTDQMKEVTGTAEAGATITVTIGSLKFTTRVDSKGNFKVTIPKQKSGVKISVTASDGINVSKATIVTVLDRTAPATPVVNAISNKMKEVSGRTEAYASVMVTIGSSKYSGRADKNGYFKITIPVQKAGNKLVITIKDSAGNSTVKSVIVLDRIAPVIPAVNAVSNLTKILSGKAEPGSVVTVIIGSKKYTTKVDTKGNYKVTIPIQKAGTKVTVTAKDAAGNVSAAKSVIVIDKTAPLAPKIKTAVKSKTKEVTGTAEAYSTITIKVGKKVIGTAKTDSKGKFKVKIKAQKKKTVLSVTATDKAKNVSKAVKVKVK